MSFLGMLPAWIRAQGRRPEVEISATPTTVRVGDLGGHPVSAAEAGHQVEVKKAQLDVAMSFREARYPKDSMLAVIAVSAAQWLAQLQTHPIRGIQLDAAARVSIAAGNEILARTQIAERLATPKLSVVDRAFTLLTAVRAFADWHYPTRLPIAENYLIQLDALGERAAPWQFDARAALVDTYYMLGQSTNMARHGVQAIRLLRTMAYRDQRPDALWSVYMKTVEGLTGFPNARAQIDALNAILQSTVTYPPALVMLDSVEMRWESRVRRNYLNSYLAASSLLGTVGQPFIGNYWVNRPTRDPASIPVTDGKIRLVETFSYGCDGCVMALYGLQRIRQQFPNIEVMAMTWTFGWWANRLVEPAEEAKLLEDFFVNQMKVTMPVGIWMGNKILEEDGGRTPGVWHGPNNRNYPTIAKPTIWAFDGHGRIRRVFMGGDRDIELQMTRTVEFLEREAAAPAQ